METPPSTHGAHDRNQTLHRGRGKAFNVALLTGKLLTVIRIPAFRLCIIYNA